MCNADAKGRSPGEVTAVSSRTLVLETIVQLHDAGEEPSRIRIMQLTGLPLTTVDDRIKLLRAEGLIDLKRQCYRPTYSHGPARAISVTGLPDSGLVKIECGDALLEISQTEAACLGRQLIGWATQVSALNRVEELNDDLLRLAGRLRQLENTNAALRRKFSRENKQPQLYGLDD